nr:PREDICTED: non-homologous end-joining factor 1-like isoform X1 [Megachile rotundata]
MGFHQCNEEPIWNNLKLNNEVYMISAIQKEDNIDILLTNFIEIWMEKLTDKIILDRCRELNPLLNVEALNYKETILNMLKDVSAHIVEASPEKIKLRTKIQGGFMKFELKLIKGTPQNFWESITKPLCISSMELARQHKFLLDLIKKKDEEIAEYKAEGAELIRKNIETKPFMEEQLKTDVSITNINDYANIFQTVTNYCNAFYSHDSSAKVTSSSDEIKKAENYTPDQDDAGQLEGVSNGNTSASKISPSQNKKNRRSANKEEITAKTRTANMAYIPTKKIKKGSNKSIL